MGQFKERAKNTSITSPAISRLVKEYSWYVRTCIRELEHIETIDSFYKKMVRAKEMNRSRLYEKYLRDLSLKDVTEDED